MTMTHSSRKRGVTLLEIVMGIAILGLVASATLASFERFRTKQVTDAAVEVVLAVFSQAHLDTISSRDDMRYGVHLDNDRITYFIAPTYATGTPTNKVYLLHSAAEIANVSLAGGGVDVMFTRLTGATTNYGTFIVRSRTDTTTAKTVTINATGATSI